MEQTPLKLMIAVMEPLDEMIGQLHDLEDRNEPWRTVILVRRLAGAQRLDQLSRTGGGKQVGRLPTSSGDEDGRKL
jgi:hypothetical protein